MSLSRSPEINTVMPPLRYTVPGLLLGLVLVSHTPLCHAGLWTHIKKDAKQAKQAIKGAAKRGGHAVKEGTRETGHAIRDGARATGHAIKHVFDSSAKTTRNH